MCLQARPWSCCSAWRFHEEPNWRQRHPAAGLSRLRVRSSQGLVRNEIQIYLITLHTHLDFSLKPGCVSVSSVAAEMEAANCCISCKWCPLQDQVQSLHNIFVSKTGGLSGFHKQETWYVQAHSKSVKATLFQVSVIKAGHAKLATFIRAHNHVLAAVEVGLYKT